VSKDLAPACKAASFSPSAFSYQRPGVSTRGPPECHHSRAPLIGFLLSLTYVSDRRVRIPLLYSSLFFRADQRRGTRTRQFDTRRNPHRKCRKVAASAVTWPFSFQLWTLDSRLSTLRSPSLDTPGVPAYHTGGTTRQTPPTTPPPATYHLPPTAHSCSGSRSAASPGSKTL